MNANRILKKLSIGIVSLALVCPLALSDTQSVSAKTVNRTKTARIRKYIIRRPSKREALIQQISVDKDTLNSKRGRYYLNIRKSLIRDETQLNNLRKQLTKKRSKDLASRISLARRKAITAQAKYANAASQGNRRIYRKYHHKLIRIPLNLHLNYLSRQMKKSSNNFTQLESKLKLQIMRTNKIIKHEKGILNKHNNSKIKSNLNKQVKKLKLQEKFYRKTNKLPDFRILR